MVEQKLTPQQERCLSAICGRAVEAGEAGCGRVVFVAGHSGEGKTHLLQAAPERLKGEVKGVRVATGGIVGGQYVAEARDRLADRFDSVLPVLTAAATLGQPALSPGVKLVLQLAEFGRAAATAANAARSEDIELATIVVQMLRAAATEAPDRPLVCLVDNADSLEGSWWVNLQFAFAQEIADGLPLVLVLGVNGPASARADEPVEPPAIGVARSLAGRGLGDWLDLQPLGAEDLDAWLGQTSPRLSEWILANTGGSVAAVCALWDALRAQGVVEATSLGWAVNGRLEEVKSPAEGLAERLADRLSTTNPDAVEATRKLLATAALEGTVFTVEAVAGAWGMDGDDVNALLRRLSADPGIVEELRPFEIENLTRDASRLLRRYRFVRPLDRQVALRSNQPGERSRVAAALASQLEHCYELEVMDIAHVVASLHREAGNPEAAARMHRLAYLVASDATVAGHCKVLLAADTDGWSESDFRAASDVLLRGCKQLDSRWPTKAGLQVAEQAEGFARSAGAAGAYNVADAICRQGRCERRAGNSQRSRELLEEALRLSQHGARRVRAVALLELGTLAQHYGPDLDASRRYLEEALEAFRGIGSTNAQGTCLYSLAFIEMHRHDYDAALSRNEEALRIAESEKDADDHASCLHQRGLIAHFAGDQDTARELTMAALDYKRRMKKRDDEAACLRLLGSIEKAVGELEPARTHAGRALAIQKEIEDIDGVAASSMLLGEVEGLLGREDVARKHLERAVETYRAIGDRDTEAYARRLLGELGSATEEPAAG